MQAGEELTGDVLEIAKRVWDLARMDAIGSARALVEVGAHKQLVNRLLEPFTHIRVLVSATDWANFLHLRDHPDAEPHIQILAREVRKCLYQGKPTLLQPGQWHLPYVLPAERQGLKHEDQLTVSAARCASLSYRTVDGHQMTVERALALREKLVGSPVHASPFEHQATPDERTGGDWWAHPEEHGNFRGWRQYRKQIPQEAVW